MMHAILPPSTLGIIGGGQLGMMTIREAHRMGYRTVVWDPDPECPAARLADEVIAAPFSAAEAAEQLASHAHVITYEFENVDPQIITVLEHNHTVHPSGRILMTCRHRPTEKAALHAGGCATVEYREANDSSSIATAIAQIGLPVVVKTSHSGYDGKGQTVLSTQRQADAFLATVPTMEGGYVVEQWVSLAHEVSVIVARRADGTMRTFPVAENVHRDNILHTTRVPAAVPPELQTEAQRTARGIAEHLGLVGLLCVEMFVTTKGRLLVNELAPRPHNSGHYTLDACDMSQFEAHVRTVCGLPLPEPTLLTSCIMVNLLGKHLARLDVSRLLEIPGIKLHLYGKSRSEERRKMGHVTIMGDTERAVLDKADEVKKLIGEK